LKARPTQDPLVSPAGYPAGGFVYLDGEEHYRIESFHRLAPFLVSLASNTDLWMFIASGGGLTAGRVDADGSLFPYRTVDQLHDAHHHTGPLTMIRVQGESGGSILWEPFGPNGSDDSPVERNLYKNVIGNRLVFEEIHRDLGLAIRAAWAGCDEFGWVRTVTLENKGSRTARMTLLDGLRNVIPYGAPLALYQQSSNLVDAYKKTEADPETGLGIFSLTAGITDRAEALEVLRANTVWCCGLEARRVHLSMSAVEVFRNNRVLSGETVLNGSRGNYLVSSSLDLEPGASSCWHLVADVGRDHGQIADLRRRILADEGLAGCIEDRLAEAGERLRRNVGSADGLQLTGRDESWSHHFANVLFNNMRGGVFDRNYDIPVADLIDFLGVRDRGVRDRLQTRLAGLPERVTIQELHSIARGVGDPDFVRLCYEYLPLYFGRRHGDPSRPWNHFSIKVRHRNGDRALHYEGNWRDIFQNWEALGGSFPGFLPSMVAKFVNASTIDGFNPYRITRDGVDWEIVTPEDPWSNIGYWGDHQIIYLVKLLEALDRHDPEALGGMLADDIFSYADVPYRLKSYGDIIENPRDTIEFDETLAARIDERVAARGSDGKLVTGPDGSIHHANLLEKLLVPALSKLSNLIPDAGIWMNTQRPEWNDANNALAGGGVSVVTLCYLRRYLAFLAGILEGGADTELPVAREIAEWFAGIEGVLEKEKGLLSSRVFDSHDRKRLMDELGGAFSRYRRKVYSGGFTGRADIAPGRVAELCRTALLFVDRSIASNRRADGLYHTYNLLGFAPDGSRVDVVPMKKMLEGQVAVLSSGLLEPESARSVLESLFASDLYRQDVRSFMLYPERVLPGFLEKNAIPEDRFESIPLLKRLDKSGNSVLLNRDAEGVLRFQGDLGNAGDLAEALDDIGRQPDWAGVVSRDREAVLGLFEDVFHHQSYTGRSGVMYAYEGLGCIYWHMVAKLLLAVQEYVQRAEQDGAPTETREALAALYFRVRAGIGYEKSVAEYGAFPTDPYSHTSPDGGAKQPGMTGQVKEEILTRLGELGVAVDNGAIRFRPSLLDADELLERPADFRFFDIHGTRRSIALEAGSLAFTYCQVPVVYQVFSGEARIRVTFTDGSTADIIGNVLDGDVGDAIHARNGRVDSLRIAIPEESIRNH